MKMWICREPDGLLVLSLLRPTWIGYWYCPADNTLDIGKTKSFPEVTFENSPMEVELKLIEKNQ